MTTFQYIMAAFAALTFLIGILVHAAVIVRIVTRLQSTVENLVKALDKFETESIKRHERINSYFAEVNEHLNRLDITHGRHEARLDEGERGHKDHENRIRELEKKCARCPAYDEG